MPPLAPEPPRPQPLLEPPRILQMLEDPSVGVVEQVRRPHDQAGVEPGAERREVHLGLVRALARGSNRVADADLRIPQRVEDGVDDTSSVIFGTLGIDEREVQVGPGRELGAPVSTHGHQSDVI
jgi:hypothetical protein